MILRSHPLSVKSPQLRFVVRGTRGTYTKHGIDTQEEHLKMISSPRAILRDEFGREPEYLNGKIENVLADNETITKTMYVLNICMCSRTILTLFFSWPTPDAGGYVELFQNLGSAIRTGAEASVKWSEATCVVEIIELALESSRMKVTVSVPEE